MKPPALVRSILVALLAVLIGAVVMGLARTRGAGGTPPPPDQWRRVR